MLPTKVGAGLEELVQNGGVHWGASLETLQEEVVTITEGGNLEKTHDRSGGFQERV